MSRHWRLFLLLRYLSPPKYLLFCLWNVGENVLFVFVRDHREDLLRYITHHLTWKLIHLHQLLCDKKWYRKIMLLYPWSCEVTQIYLFRLLQNMLDQCFLMLYLYFLLLLIHIHLYIFLLFVRLLLALLQKIIILFSPDLFL